MLKKYVIKENSNLIFARMEEECFILIVLPVSKASTNIFGDACNSLHVTVCQTVEENLV